jgi:hypothetical protein
VGNAQGLIEALRRAVEAAPDDAELRVHLAELLLDNGELRDATVHLGIALGQQPANTKVQQLMRRALEPSTPLTPPHDSFDWGSAETELAGVVGPEFVDEPAPYADPTLAERPALSLADVGGMAAVKQRLESSFFLPPLLLASGIAAFFDQQRDKR